MRVAACLFAIALVACGGEDDLPYDGDARPDQGAAVDGMSPREDGSPPVDARVPVDALIVDAAVDAEPPDAAPACRADGDCPGAQRCAAGACVEPLECGDDVDCLGDRICDEGLCADRCREDGDCPGPRLCTVETGRCREGGSCAVAADCDSERTCSGGLCVDRCVDCPGAQICGADGLCAEPAACGDDVDCLGDRICVDGACADACGEDADCPGTRGCDLASGRCPEAAPCFAEGDCDGERICVDGACAAGCDAMTPCPAGLVCGAEAVCVPRCDGANPCAPGLYCDAGVCGPPPACAGDLDCPAGLFCDRAAGRCTDQPQCVRDQDCGGARVCAEGRCTEPARCFVPADCDPGRTCLAGACVDTCPGRPCPGAQVCGPDGLCLEGDGCRADVDCLGARVCVAGACADPCREDADCPGSRSCVAGRCPEPAICFSPDDCDPGRVCLDFACAAGCAVDADCPGAQTCAGGRCAEPAMCGGDLDCLDGRICVGGACTAACRVDADCPGGAVCDAATGRCGAPDRCALDGDCPGGLVCESAVCVAPECEQNDDCAGACVGRRCAAGPPRLCAGDGDCAGLVCAPLGGCVPAGACLDAAGCPPAAPVCSGGACVGCAVDGDCPGAQRCVRGGCALLAACGGDLDCPGTRTCDGGLCLAAPCVGDRFDLVGGGSPLALRTYDDLVLCDGATDSHLVDQPADRPLRIRVVHATGDLALTVRDAEDGVVLAAVDEPYGVERVELAPVGAARRLRVDVSGEGESVPYALVLEALPVDACPADAFEGLRGDDTVETATAIGAGELRHRLCPGDVDVFTLDLPAGIALVATAFPGAVAERVGLVLRGPGGAELARGAVDGDGDLALEATIAAPGRHALLLSLPADGVPAGGVADRLTIALAAAPDAAALACGHAFELRPGAPLTLTPGPAVVRVPTGCGGGGNQSWVARFTLDAPATVDLRLDGPQFGGSIAVRADCADPQSNLRCAVGDPMGMDLGARIDGLALAAGAYAVVVQAAPAGPLTLRLERR